MPTTKLLAVKDLSLDLRNFRTVPQLTEAKSIHAMISINPDWFWALLDSILTDGYLPTENIIVLKQGKDLIVKEGNRRIGGLKLILGQIDRKPFDFPTDMEKKIQALTSAWKTENGMVPCAVFAASEAGQVDKVITLAHGKGEKAGRDKWNAVARARHNRDVSGVSEPALDLLEKYLSQGKNRTPAQAERWAGVYPLSVLDEVMKRLSSRFEVASSRELADNYPKPLKNVTALEKLLHAIGLESLAFPQIRDTTSDFAVAYGLPPLPPPAAPPTPPGGPGTPTPTPGPGGPTTGPAAPAPAKPTKKPTVAGTSDPKAVIRTLKKFTPRGARREKVVTLLIEARTLKIEKHPHSFCFLLRSMFEISAKEYCEDHKGTSGAPLAAKANGDDRTLVDILRDVTTHLTNNHTDKQKIKLLHAAMADLAAPNGFLSVTSMNQLIHNRSFTMTAAHICSLFFNIFPLLEMLNQ